MDWKDFGVVGLRAAALALDLLGKTYAAITLFKLADRIEAGENVDEYMGKVAALLKTRSVNSQDWIELYDKIHAASAKLMAPEAPAGNPEGGS